MSQHKTEMAPRRSSLDRAIIASVIAMAAMNVIVLAQQLQAVPQFAIGLVSGSGLA
jgi:hypothetical protein